VKASGFRDYEQTNIAVNANDALRFDITLAVGQTSETIEVNASAVHVEATATHVGTLSAVEPFRRCP